MNYFLTSVELRVLALAIGTMAALGAGAVAAAPFAYSESVNGDLSVAGTAVGSLDIGLNTVEGQHICTLSACDFDSFAFTLPSGLEIDAISFTFQATLPPNITAAGVGFELRELPAFSFLNHSNVDLLGPSNQSMFSAVLPITDAGEYLIRHASSGAGITLDYTWTLSVSQIPEPATLALLGLGLAGLGFSRRKRVVN